MTITIRDLDEQGATLVVNWSDNNNVRSEELIRLRYDDANKVDKLHLFVGTQLVARAWDSRRLHPYQDETIELAVEI